MGKPKHPGKYVDIVPTASDSFGLGTAANRWGDIYVPWDGSDPTNALEEMIEAEDIEEWVLN